MKSINFGLILVMGCAVFAGLSPFANPVHADVQYDGTGSSDKIYFGCNSSETLLLVVIKTGDAAATSRTFTMGGTLTINGKMGNDTIEPIHESTKEGFQFGDLSMLNFAQIKLYGYTGNDKITGTPFDDMIYGEVGNDSLIGGEGDDDLDGGVGNDYLEGGDGVDNLIGGVGNDLLDGSKHDDTLDGGVGNDVLMGGSGNDSLDGNYGDDILMGGTGIDDIDGGLNRDIFICRSADHAQPCYDGGAQEDCSDTGAIRANIEVTSSSDPYENWAFRYEYGNGEIYQTLTSSNEILLMEARAQGASILLSGDGGDMPFAGNFDTDAYSDDVAVYRTVANEWIYDYNHDATSNERHSPWGLRGDRPVAGDFDGDNRMDDVAVFRPSNRTWYFDYNHNGTRDGDPVVWEDSIPGDIPVAGDFDGDGRFDDIAVFRPFSRNWRFDYDHNGTTDSGPTYWAHSTTGDIPVAGDFDGDRTNDDVAVFKTGSHMWYYDYNHNGTTDVQRGPWGADDDVPIAGDFDSDGRRDDVGVFRLGTTDWYYDYDHDGDTDPAPGAHSGPWGAAGMPLHAIHKQYWNVCGPASMAMVMSYVGMADTSDQMYFYKDLNQPANPVSAAAWNPATMVDVGYKLSMEHIMYEGYHRYFSIPEDGWPPNDPDFINGDFLNTADFLPGGVCDGSTRYDDGAYYEIAYDIGNVNWNPATQTTSGRAQSWTIFGHSVGTACDGCTDRGLPFVANKYTPWVKDAYPIDTTVGAGGNFASLSHLTTVIKAFIDHNLPLVVAVERGGHFNTIVGYWNTSSGFYIYTADPVDGYGRPYQNKTMRWRKILLTEKALNAKAGVIVALMLFGHAQNGCGSSTAWAEEIDDDFHRDILCGYMTAFGQ